jgi:hypothetical protein
LPAAATEGRPCQPVVEAFTWNSAPNALPTRSNRRPAISPSVEDEGTVPQTTTKPVGVAATAGRRPGEMLIVNCGPRGVPAASNTRPKTPGAAPPPPSLNHTAMARPVACTATSGRCAEATGAVLTWNCPPCGTPLASKRRPCSVRGLA